MKCTICNGRTYTRVLEEDKSVKYYPCNCMQNVNNIEKREGIKIVGFNKQSGELIYEELFKDE